jgi:hypothetical protein
MSYEPSHRKPPRQERWPNATPGEGWPAYAEGNGQQSWVSAEALAGSRNGYGAVSSGYSDASGGYSDARGGRTATADYGVAPWGYYQDGKDWDGYAQPGHEFGGPASYPEQDEYPAVDAAVSSVLVAPDTLGEWWRQEAGKAPAGRGPIVGAVMGILAAAVAIGMATLAAAFVRPQASPVSMVGGAFIGRLPATLKTHLMAHFGAHGQAVLLLGTAGLIAIVLGIMARRNVSVGVTGIAAFGLLAAFIAVTRPESRASDVIPSAIGGLAGIIALLWLARASAPVAALRPAYSGSARRESLRGGSGRGGSGRGGSARSGGRRRTR